MPGPASSTTMSRLSALRDHAHDSPFAIVHGVFDEVADRSPQRVRPAAAQHFGFVAYRDVLAEFGEVVAQAADQRRKVDRPSSPRLWRPRALRRQARPPSSSGFPRSSSASFPGVRDPGRTQREGFCCLANVRAALNSGRRGTASPRPNSSAAFARRRNGCAIARAPKMAMADRMIAVSANDIADCDVQNALGIALT